MSVPAPLDGVQGGPLRAASAQAWRLGEIASRVGGVLTGDSSLLVTGVNGLAEAGPSELSFYGNPRYRDALARTRAGAVLVGADAPASNGAARITVGDPHLAFARASSLFFPRPLFAPGTSPGAHVHPTASVASTATVMAGATVQARARVGERTVLFPGAYVGEDAGIGTDCILYPNVTIRERCKLGDRVTVHASAVIGADGFGFAFDASQPAHVKVPQVGIVRIEDDVEIGACSCIDRATLGETVVGRGTKIDNLVQIAHNVRIGPLSLLCAQSGISGSAELGSGVILAGQVGVVGHIRVGDLAKVGAQSGVAHDVEDNAVLSGSPAVPHREWLKASAAQRHLPELLREIRELRHRVEALEKGEKQ